MKRLLKVDPQVLYGEEAMEVTRPYGSLSIGVYLWWGGNNIIAIKKKKTLATEAHEMRHAWQFKHDRDQFSFTETRKPKWINVLTAPLNAIKYIYKAKEVDAEKYAIMYCRKHQLKKDLRIAKYRHWTNNIIRYGAPAAFFFLIGFFLAIGLVIY